MTLPDILRHMAAAGATAEVMADFVARLEAEKKAKPSTAALRQRRYRERKRAAQEMASQNETSRDVTSVTRDAQDVTVTNGDAGVSEVSPHTPLQDKKDPLKGVPKVRHLDEVVAAHDLWNQLAERCDLPRANKLTPDRRRAIKARLADGGLEGWKSALASVEASAFCRGHSDRGWRANLDYVASPKGFNKLVDGAFLRPGERPSAVGDEPDWALRLRGFRELNNWRPEWGPKPGEPGYRGPAKQAEDLFA